MHLKNNVMVIIRVSTIRMRRSSRLLLSVNIANASDNKGITHYAIKKSYSKTINLTHPLKLR